MVTRSRKNDRNRQDTLNEHNAHKESEVPTISNIESLQGLKPLQTEISKLNSNKWIDGSIQWGKRTKISIELKGYIIIASQTKRVDELEKYYSRQNIGNTGLKTNHKSYSHVTQEPNNETDHENANK